MSSLRFHLRFPYFSPKIRMFSKKKKKVRKRVFEKYLRRRVPGVADPWAKAFKNGKTKNDRFT